MTQGIERRRARLKQHRVADRPHAITIALGILGPLSALIALVVTASIAYSSWRTATQSLEVAQSNMKVGQRAYLFIENSHSRLLLVKARRDDVGDSLVGAIEQSFTMRNSGRTPATLHNLTLRFRLPLGWWEGTDSRHRFAKDGDAWVYTQPMGRELPQDGERGFSNAYMFSLSDEAVGAYSHWLKHKTFPGQTFETFSKAYPVQVEATLDYTDVFNERHTANWTDQLTEMSSVDVMPQSH